MASVGRNQLVNNVAKNSGNSQKLVSEVLDAILNEILESISEGNEVKFPGFGAWSVRLRNARTGRNPRTGDVLHIPARTAPVFKAGTKLKEAAASSDES